MRGTSQPPHLHLSARSKTCGFWRTRLQFKARCSTQRRVLEGPWRGLAVGPANLCGRHLWLDIQVLGRLARHHLIARGDMLILVVRVQSVGSRCRSGHTHQIVITVVVHAITKIRLCVGLRSCQRATWQHRQVGFTLICRTFPIKETCMPLRSAQKFHGERVE